jgi:hypothetical protein
MIPMGGDLPASKNCTIDDATDPAVNYQRLDYMKVNITCCRLFNGFFKKIITAGPILGGLVKAKVSHLPLPPPI